jgi:hypothetical protein
MFPCVNPQGRIVSHGFDLGTWDRAIDLDAAASELRKSILEGPNKILSTPTVFVGYGYGCVLVQKFLSNLSKDPGSSDSQIADFVAAVILFGPPLLGWANPLIKWTTRSLKVESKLFIGLGNGSRELETTWNSFSNRFSNKNTYVFVYLPKDLSNRPAKVDGEMVVDGGVKTVLKEQGMKAKLAAKVGVEAPTKEKDRERDAEQLRQGHGDIVGEDQAPFKEHGIKADLFDSTFGEVGQVAWFSGLNDPRFTLLKEILVSAIETRQLLGAAARGEENTLMTLTANSIDVNRSNKENETALHIGAGCGYLPIVTTLLGTGNAELDLRDDAGNTLLHRVVLNPGTNSEKIAEQLLIAGASLSVKNSEGQTPKRLAEDRMARININRASEETPAQLAKDYANRLSALRDLFTKPPLVEGLRTKSNLPRF